MCQMTVNTAKERGILRGDQRQLGRFKKEPDGARPAATGPGTRARLCPCGQGAVFSVPWELGVWAAPAGVWLDQSCGTRLLGPPPPCRLYLARVRVGDVAPAGNHLEAGGVWAAPCCSFRCLLSSHDPLLALARQLDRGFPGYGPHDFSGRLLSC